MKLVVNVGGMFSGKSTELQRQGERHILAGQDVLFVSPDFDKRYGSGVIATHKGNKVHSLAVDVERDILEQTFAEKPEASVLCFDEIQFFNESVVDAILFLVQTVGKTVYVSGLDMDFAGRPFPNTARLMAIADEVNKFHAVCSRCGEDAVFSARLDTSNDSVVDVGEKDKYTPLCRKCYKKFNKESEK